MKGQGKRGMRVFSHLHAELGAAGLWSPGGRSLATRALACLSPREGEGLVAWGGTVSAGREAGTHSVQLTYNHHLLALSCLPATRLGHKGSLLPLAAMLL